MGEHATPLEQYVAGFRERVTAMRAPGQEVIDAPGVVALAGRNGELRNGRVLVIDDRALDLVSGRLDELFPRVVLVLDSAPRCRELLAASGAFRSEPATAMVCEHLQAIAVHPLPVGLALHALDPAPGATAPVRLADAAAAALAADPEVAPTQDLEDFVAFLRAMPDTEFFAAVDDGGHVRATSAATRSGETAAVFFVSTDPSWRGQGVGTAMTARALRAAAERGARRACLDASASGASIYRRLGFTDASPVALFVHDGR
jgi:GNAT superfamily N-acetyltransferase